MTDTELRKAVGEFVQYIFDEFACCHYETVAKSLGVSLLAIHKIGTDIIDMGVKAGSKEVCCDH